MESTNKTRTKFKDTKFVRFVVKHKKPFIIGGVVTALIVAIVIPVVLTNRAFSGDFTYAYNAYVGKKQPSLEETTKAVFDSTIITEVVDGKEAVISSSDTTLGYDVTIPSAGEYSFYINNRTMESGFKDTEFSVSIDGEEVLDTVAAPCLLGNPNEQTDVIDFGVES